MNQLTLTDTVDNADKLTEIKKDYSDQVLRDITDR